MKVHVDVSQSEMVCCIHWTYPVHVDVSLSGSDFSIVLDNQLHVDQQVTAVSTSFFCQMHQSLVNRRSQTKDALRVLVQAFIHTLPTGLCFTGCSSVGMLAR